MLPRICRFALTGFVLAGCLRAGVAHALTEKLEVPLQLSSVEWLVADTDVIVRGVVVDVATDQTWNLVTVEVRETLKGAKAQRVKIALQKFAEGDAALAEAKKLQREQLWLLKRQAAGAA